MRELELIPDESEMVERSLYPLLPVVGPRHGKAVGAIMAGARSGEWELRRRRDRRGRRRRSSSPTSSSSPRGRARDTRWPRTATCSSRSTPRLDDELRGRGSGARGGPSAAGHAREAAGYEISDRVRVAICWRRRRRRHVSSRTRVARRRGARDGGCDRSVRARPALRRCGARESVELDGDTLELRWPAPEAARRLELGGGGRHRTRRVAEGPRSSWRARPRSSTSPTRSRRPWSSRASRLGRGDGRHRRPRARLARAEHRRRLQPPARRDLAVHPGHGGGARHDRLLLPRLPRPRAVDPRRARGDPGRHARQPHGSAPARVRGRLRERRHRRDALPDLQRRRLGGGARDRRCSCST